MSCPFAAMGSVIFFLVTCYSLSISADEIIGGEEVSPHSMPYMAFITFTNKENYKERCGGILIKEDIVLTAAHCNGTNMQVILGAHNIKTAENSWQELKVCRTAPHRNHKEPGNDIMLLRLIKKASLNRYVLPLPLPLNHRGRKVEPGTVCSVAGWGKYTEEIMSRILRKVDVKVVSESVCTKFTKMDTKSFICAGDLVEKKKFAFFGDSGGPLFCGKDLQGIVHAVKRPINLYTVVSTHMNWIKTTMHTMKCKKEE